MTFLPLCFRALFVKSSEPSAFLIGRLLILFQISAGVKKIDLVCCCSLNIFRVSLTRSARGLDIVPTGVLNCSSMTHANNSAFLLVAVELS